jgi:lactate racemase
MHAEATVDIAYGKGCLGLRLEPRLAEWHVVRPKNELPLPHPQGVFREACRAPIASRPLRDVVKPQDRVVIVTSDGTRPVPNRLLLPWLLEEMRVPLANITVLLGTGTHRPNTDDEIRHMLGPELARQVRTVNHDAFDPERNVQVGTALEGVPVTLDEAYVHADKRIVVGFIEPHFFAGFSGGPKGVVPGIAGIESILHVHRYELIKDPQSTWGRLADNPLHQAVTEMVALCPPDFLVNVTLNNEKNITGLFCGDYMGAHQAGCAHVRENAMVAVPNKFPVVVTSNSGFPLDQSLYQSVKGMSAAARIAEDGGTIFIASECSDGIPAHGNFGKELQRHKTLESVDTWLRGLASPALDQWQIQVLVQILQRQSVCIYSSLDPDTVRSCQLTHVEDLEASLREHIETLGTRVPVAVLPEGPVTIPYVA